jgi:cellulose synthase/poly-beta-1,6-N-acetylglucosamine synthase-like glycosyltransferase
MMREILIILGAFCALITLPGTVELLILSVAGALPRRKEAELQLRRVYRFAIVVPAHNEEQNIARCVKSLLAADSTGIDRGVVVVADNCLDHTGDQARAAGARVLVRASETERGKGYALDFAFRTLAPEGWDGFAVVDADSEVAPSFLVEMAARMRLGAAAAQCRYLVRNAGDSIRTRLMRVAGAAFNVLRPRGRERCGLSAGIYGNGFALSAETLRAVPYTASSLVEDVEYHLALVEADRQVRFVDTTAVYGDMPVAGAGVKTQRARWEGGRFRMIREKTLSLAAKVLRGRFRLLEPCLDLLLLPLAFHVCLLLLAAATPYWPVRAVGLFGLGVVVFHLAAAIIVTGGGFADVAALLAAPFYVGWKILLIPRLARSSGAKAAWARTERAAQRNIP